MCKKLHDYPTEVVRIYTKKTVHALWLTITSEWGRGGKKEKIKFQKEKKKEKDKRLKTSN